MHVLTQAKDWVVLHQRPGVVVHTVTLIDQQLTDISGCHVCWDLHHFTGPIFAPHLYYLQTHQIIVLLICKKSAKHVRYTSDVMCPKLLSGIPINRKKGKYKVMFTSITRCFDEFTLIKSFSHYFVIPKCDTL